MLGLSCIIRNSSLATFSTKVGSKVNSNCNYIEVDIRVLHWSAWLIHMMLIKLFISRMSMDCNKFYFTRCFTYIHIKSLHNIEYYTCTRWGRHIGSDRILFTFGRGRIIAPSESLQKLQVKLQTFSSRRKHLADLNNYKFFLPLTGLGSTPSSESACWVWGWPAHSRSSQAD